MKHLSSIIEIVSRETGVSVKDIINPSRTGSIIFARHLSMWACRWYTKAPMKMIAEIHGKRTHGTIINACKSIDSQASYNKSIADLCRRIALQIQNHSVHS